MANEELCSRYTMHLVIGGLMEKGVLTEDYLKENKIDYREPKGIGKITLDDDKNCRQIAKSIIDAGVDIHTILGHEKYSDHDFFPEHGQDVVMHLVERKLNDM